ncbi:MAG: TolC family protein [Bacteroidales bacterium]
MKNVNPLSIALLSLIILLPFSLHGQSIWSLERCIDYALEHNLDIREQHLETGRADQDVTEAYANLAPSLNAGSRAGFNFGRSIDEVTNEFSTERVASQNFHVSSSMTLFAGFQTINNIRRNLALQTALKHDSESLENETILTIANAYLQVLYFEDMLEVAEQQLENAREQVEQTRIMVEGGALSKGELLDMEANAAEREVSYTNTGNQLSLAYLELINLLELDPTEDFTVERPPVEVEDLTVMHEPENVYSKALQIEPSVAAAAKRIELAEHQLSMARGQRYPSLTLNSSIGTAYSEGFKRMEENQDTPVLETIPYNDQLSENLFRSVHITLQIPIFNNLRTRTNIQHAHIDRERAEIRLERTKTRLNQVIHQSHADAMAAYQAYLSNTKALEAARESLSHADESFRLGLMSTMEYNEAITRFNRAETNLIQSTYEFVFMVKILEFYQGEGFVL